MATPPHIELHSSGNILEAICPLDQLADLPLAVVIGGRVYLLVEELLPTPIYRRTDDAHNFDAIKAEGRGASPFTWVPGHCPSTEPETPEAPPLLTNEDVLAGTVQGVH